MLKLFVSLVAGFCFFSACSPNNTTEAPELKQYFDKSGTDGFFAMFDNGNGNFTIYNMPLFRDSQFLPASTFKIVNALIGIETGRVRDENEVFRWDSIVRSEAAWNRDLSMKEAFAVSAVPWFQELARKIGHDTMQRWIDTLGYGSLKKKPVISEKNLDTFWLDNSLKVTGDEQLGLVKKLYFGQLPFQARTQRVVKDIMLREQNANYSLSYKTGWGYDERNHVIGWITGWIEENKHPYFFVLLMDSPDRNYDMTDARVSVLKQILAAQGFMQGKK
jgi:beta-lactamase class D